MPKPAMDATTTLATLLSRRAAVLASVALALASLALAVWLLPRVQVSVTPVGTQGSWVVTLALQPSCGAGPLAALLKSLT